MSSLPVPALVGRVPGAPPGGFIFTYSSWRWIFFINLPIGLLGIVLATLFIDDVRETNLWPLDIQGFLLAGLGLSGLMFGFETAGRGVLPGSLVAVLLAAGALALALYGLHSPFCPAPIIDPRPLAIPTFAGAIIGGPIFRLGIGAPPFLLP